MPLLSIHFFQARNLGVVLNSYLLPLIHQKVLLVLPCKYIMILSIFTFPMPPPHPNWHHFLPGLLTWPLNWPVSTLGLFHTPVSTPPPPTTLPLEKLPLVFKMHSKLFPLACHGLCDPPTAYFPAPSCWLCFGHIGHCSQVLKHMDFIPASRSLRFRPVKQKPLSLKVVKKRLYCLLSHRPEKGPGPGARILNHQQQQG